VHLRSAADVQFRPHPVVRNSLSGHPYAHAGAKTVQNCSHPIVPGCRPRRLTDCSSLIPCQALASPESITTLARFLIATREEEQMYLGGGVVGIVVIVLIVLFLVGRI
jgi:hypothetical protein